MKESKKIKDIRKKILEGLDKTYIKLIETKKKNGGVLVVSENGKIVVIDPNKE
jgi:hypothetical protein